MPPGEGAGPSVAAAEEALAGVVGRGGMALQRQLAEYAVDGVTPGAVVFVKDVPQVQAVLRVAARERLAVSARGGGTALATGYRPERVDVVLSTRKLERILEHEPAEMTATVEAGIALGALNGALSKHGQWLPLEAPLASRATVGGVLAVNASGPHRFGYGTARDRLIGIRVVDAAGTLIHGGGKVVKNVAGYDLPKIFVGSLGTLGIITEATFKLAPLPKSRQSIIGAFAELEPALEAAQALLKGGLRPLAFELLNATSMTYLAARSGVPSMADRRFFLALDVSGGQAATQRQILQAHRLINEGGGKSLVLDDAFAHDGFWSALVDMGRHDDRPASMHTRGSISLQELPRLVHGCEAIAESSHMEVALSAHLMGGSLRGAWWDMGGGPAEPKMLSEAVQTLRKAAANWNGSFLVESCSPGLKRSIDVWGPAPESLPVMRRLKEQFDPQRILNPGRFVGGL